MTLSVIFDTLNSKNHDVNNLKNQTIKKPVNINTAKMVFAHLALNILPSKRYIANKIGTDQNIGWNINACFMFKFSNDMYARVIPQPGHWKPKNFTNKQDTLDIYIIAIIIIMANVVDMCLMVRNKTKCIFISLRSNPYCACHRQLFLNAESPLRVQIPSILCKQKKPSRKMTFLFGGVGGISIAKQSFLLADRSLCSGARLRNFRLKNLPPATFFKRRKPS